MRFLKEIINPKGVTSKLKIFERDYILEEYIKYLDETFIAFFSFLKMKYNKYSNLEFSLFGSKAYRIMNNFKNGKFNGIYKNSDMDIICNKEFFEKVNDYVKFNFKNDISISSNIVNSKSSFISLLLYQGIDYVINLKFNKIENLLQKYL